VNTKKIIIIGGAILAIAAVAFSLFKGGTTSYTSPDTQIPEGDALDVTIDFYNEWLAASLSTTTNPFESGLINSTVLSDEVRAAILENRENRAEGDLDAVFCQAEVPERVGGKEILKLEREAQIMILARGFEERSPYQAVVTLGAVKGEWQIIKIDCLQGEVAPVREFDFERTGFLLKSVPPPLNPEYWHLVYEEAGKPGHTIPLFFDAESICIAADGTEGICDPSSFVEPAKALVQAAMLDTGADVRRVTFE
jgi:hypothetical protein